MVTTNLTAGTLGLVPQTDEFRNASHSLVLLFAMSVLEDVLRQLRDEGRFASKRNEMKRLMEASRSVLPWADFTLIDEAREKRNGVAHKREFLPAGDCARYIDGIEAELVRWQVLPGRVQYDYTIERRPSS